MEEKQRTEFSENTRQNILYRLAKASEDELGRSFLIIYEVTNMLIGKLGTKSLEEKWKEDFNEKMLKLRKIGMYVSQINFFFFGIDDQRFKKEIDVTNPNFLNARKMYAMIVKDLDIIYEAFYTLMESTERLKYLDIPNEYFGDKYRKQSNVGYVE